MRTYSDEFKSAMIRRLTGPNAISARALSREVGVSQTSLSIWLRQAKLNTAFSTQVSPMPTRPQDKTPQQKLQLVLQASSLSDEQLGPFLRKEGIHAAHLDQWRAEMLAALKPQTQSKPSKELRDLKKKNKRLQKELSRKDAALAETAALLVLPKKVQELWGDEDTDT